MDDLVRSAGADPAAAAELFAAIDARFVAVGADGAQQQRGGGVPLVRGGADIVVTPANYPAFVRALREFRVNEFRVQVTIITHLRHVCVSHWTYV